MAAIYQYSVSYPSLTMIQIQPLSCIPMTSIVCVLKKWVALEMDEIALEPVPL